MSLWSKSDSGVKCTVEERHSTTYHWHNGKYGLTSTALGENKTYIWNKLIPHYTSRQNILDLYEFLGEVVNDERF